jgi:hypothetical protein
MKTIKKPKSNLKSVLALINVGRRALGLTPLREIPKGIADDPEQSPLARAWDAGIGSEGDHCYVPRYSAHFDSRKQACALAAALGTSIEKRMGSGGFAAYLPEELSRFEYELEQGAFPELIDRDLMELEDAAERLGVKTETLEDLVSAELLAVIPKWQQGSFVRWSVLESHFPRAGRRAGNNHRKAA